MPLRCGYPWYALGSYLRILMRRLLRHLCPLLFALLQALLPSMVAAQQTAGSEARQPARVMLLGLFHFDNPGLDAVKYTPLDVMKPAEQAYLEGLAYRLSAFAPTKVLLEYPEKSDAVINQRYTDYRAGRYVLGKNEIYQLGFRVAQRAGLQRVHGFDTEAPKYGDALWSQLGKAPATEKKLMALIASESARLQALHRSKPLADVLALSNAAAEDRRNKGFYMLLNDVAASDGQFLGADASAHWWHRNLRMYALVQAHAQPGERVLVIAGSGHTAILRDLLRADAERVEADVLPYLPAK